MKKFLIAILVLGVIGLAAAYVITMPRTMVRLSAGREQMDEALQALCFLAGANSIFYGDKLLTTSNPQADRDRRLFERLGLKAQGGQPVAQNG